MEIKKVAAAGTVESSDIMVVIEPNDQQGIVIRLKSSVEKQFAEQIRQVVMDTLAALQVDRAIVEITDKGALDCVIRARVQTAAYRAAEEACYSW